MVKSEVDVKSSQGDNSQDNGYKCETPHCKLKRGDKALSMGTKIALVSTSDVNKVTNDLRYPRVSPVHSSD